MSDKVPNVFEDYELEEALLETAMLASPARRPVAPPPPPPPLVQTAEATKYNLPTAPRANFIDLDTGTVSLGGLTFPLQFSEVRAVLEQVGYAAARFQVQQLATIAAKFEANEDE